jgi:hypothetical protein
LKKNGRNLFCCHNTIFHMQHNFVKMNWIFWKGPSQYVSTWLAISKCPKSHLWSELLNFFHYYMTLIRPKRACGCVCLGGCLLPCCWRGAVTVTRCVTTLEHMTSYRMPKCNVTWPRLINSLTFEPRIGCVILPDKWFSWCINRG